jgi:hypothetical protein
MTSAHRFLTTNVIRDEIGTTLVDLAFGNDEKARIRLQALLLALDEDMAITERDYAVVHGGASHYSLNH